MYSRSRVDRPPILSWCVKPFKDIAEQGGVRWPGRAVQLVVEPASENGNNSGPTVVRPGARLAGLLVGGRGSASQAHCDLFTGNEKRPAKGE